MKNSKKMTEDAKNMLKAIVSVFAFFLVAISINAAGSQWYLWALWVVCAFVWIGMNARD